MKERKVTFSTICASVHKTHFSPLAWLQKPISLNEKRRAHFVGSEDNLAFARVSSDDIPIYTNPTPPVFMTPVRPTKQMQVTKSEQDIAQYFMADELPVIYDDYDEQELPEVPLDYGCTLRPGSVRGHKSIPAEGVDYRQIFSKCYRNARRKTKAIFDTKETTVGDLADDRVSVLARYPPWEPLVQEWLALGSDLLTETFTDLDYESLIPTLNLGFEEVVIQVQVGLWKHVLYFLGYSGHYCWFSHRPSVSFS